MEGAPLEDFLNVLIGLGFVEGKLEPIGDHYHHYRPEFDEDAVCVLKAFEWRRTPLREEDVQ